MNFIFFFLFSYIAKVSSDRCCERSYREEPRYTLIRSNVRSTSSIISRTRVSNVKKCEEFAVSKKALAFNFRHGSQHVDYSKRNDPYYANCFVLGCPDIHNFTSLVNDSSFSYYSLYSSRVHRLAGNLTCLPSIGLFAYFEESQNYANARERCANFHGMLADVASEKRTEDLAKFTSDSPIYVGLSNRDDEKIWKNEYNEPLSCFDYSAWGQGEPASSRGCGTLVRMEGELPFWKVVPCDLTLPYLCEVLPNRKRNDAHRTETTEP